MRWWIKNCETDHLQSLFRRPASRNPGGAAHQFALTSRRGGGPQTESEPLTGLGEPAEHFKSRATHIVRDIVSPISGYTRSRITRRFACSEWVPSRPPLPDHHLGEKAVTSLRWPIDQHHCVIGFANTCHPELLNDFTARWASG